MKKGNVILSTAALVLSLASAFAFKAHAKLRGTGTIYTRNSSQQCVLHNTCKATTTTGGSCAVSGTLYNGLTNCQQNHTYSGSVTTAD
jgi:Family of unknown function (DUF6520)